MFEVKVPAWLLLVLVLIGLTVKIDDGGVVSIAGVKWH